MMLSGKVFGYQCPDDEAGVVIFTPMTASDPKHKPVIDIIIQHVQLGAQDAGLKVIGILGKNATIAAYRSLGQCSNVRAFINIGHSDPYGIYAADGYIKAEEIGDVFKFNYKTFFYNYACNSFKDPLKDAFINKAKAGKYVGAVDLCYLGGVLDTHVALCYLENAFNTTNLHSLLTTCVADNQNKFPGEKSPWRVGGKGRPFIMSPFMAESILDRSEL